MGECFKSNVCAKRDKIHIFQPLCSLLECSTDLPVSTTHSEEQSCILKTCPRRKGRTRTSLRTSLLTLISPRWGWSLCKEFILIFTNICTTNFVSGSIFNWDRISAFLIFSCENEKYFSVILLCTILTSTGAYSPIIYFVSFTVV